MKDRDIWDPTVVAAVIIMICCCLSQTAEAGTAVQTGEAETGNSLSRLVLGLGASMVTLPADGVVQQYIIGNGSLLLDTITPYATELGGGAGTLALGALLLALDPPAAEILADAAIATAITVKGLKILLGRARPYAEQGAGLFHGPSLLAERHSMPSGHTANAFAMATVMGKRYPEHRGLAYAAAAFVGYTRIYLRQHWPSDVIAGAAIGVFFGEMAAAGKLNIVKGLRGR